MKKNGFIATSILYAFFMVFITLFLALIANYIHNQMLITKIKNESSEKLIKINATKLSELEPGDFIKLTPVDRSVDSTAAKVYSTSETRAVGKWVVIYKDSNNIYLLSDVDVPSLAIDVYRFGRMRTTQLSISSFNEAQGDSAHGRTYERGLMFNYNPSSPSSIQTVSSDYKIKVTLPYSNILAAARNLNVDDYVKDAIFDTNSDFVVVNSNFPTGNGYTSINASYCKTFEKKSFTYLDTNTSVCNGSLNGENAKYNSGNTFGYIHVGKDALSNTNYIDYCYYPNKTPDTNSIYNFRLMAVIRYSKFGSSVEQYLAGGKGIATDPYILTDGVKQ